MDWKVFIDQDPRLGAMHRRLTGRAAWPMLAAVGCGVLVLVVPVVLALLAGLTVGLVVYVIGSAIAKVGDLLTGGGSGGSASAERTVSPVSGNDLRENVRVVRRP